MEYEWNERCVVVAGEDGFDHCIDLKTRQSFTFGYDRDGIEKTENIFDDIACYHFAEPEYELERVLEKFENRWKITKY